MVRNFNKAIVILAMVLFNTSIHAYPQRCVLVSQSTDNVDDYNTKKLICDYTCADGNSKTRYVSAPYCPAEIGSN